MPAPIDGDGEAQLGPAPQVDESVINSLVQSAEPPEEPPR